MLKKIKAPGGLLGTLIRDKIIKSAYFRKIIPEIGYYDIVPLMSDCIEEKMNIFTKIHVGGKGFNLKKSINSCAGEVLERISLMRIFSDEEFMEREIDLTEYFSKKELSRHKIPLRKKSKMILLKNLFSKKEEYVLADLIVPNPQTRTIPKFSTSVGNSFHKKDSFVIRESLLEVIERHSLLQAGYTQREIPKIKNLSRTISRIVLKIKDRLKINVSFYDLATEIPCPVICCKIDFNNKTVFGCSASLKSEEACKKALSEALQLWVSSKFVFKIKKRDNLEKKFIKLMKKPEINFSEEEITMPPNSSESRLYSFFKKKSMKILYVDITPKEIKKYGKSIKVFCPDLLQFQNNSSIVYKLNERLLNHSNQKVNPFI